MHLLAHFVLLSSTVQHALGSPTNFNRRQDTDAVRPIEYLESNDAAHSEGDIRIKLPTELADKANNFFSIRQDDCITIGKRDGVFAGQDCFYEDLLDMLWGLRNQLNGLTEILGNVPKDLALPSFQMDDIAQVFLRFAQYFYDYTPHFIQDLDPLLLDPVTTTLFFFVLGPVIKKSFFVGGEMFISAKDFFSKKDYQPKCFDLNSAYAPHCTNKVCKGEAGKCTTPILLGCECVPTECPVPTEKLYRCEDCSGEKGYCKTDDKKNCRCVHTTEIFVNPTTKQQYDELQQIISKLPVYEQPKPDPSSKKSKHCYKEDPKRMEDQNNWKFVRASVLTDTIKKQCDQYKQSGAPGDHEVQDFAMKDDWDYVKLKVYEPEPGVFTQELCHSMFSEINVGCDSSPLQENNPNQFDWKWGGEMELENGIRASIEPVWSRVWTDGDSNIQPSSSSCEILNGFTDKDYKGNNGVSLNTTEARQTLQQCVHQAQYLDRAEYLNCGGLIDMNFRRENGYASAQSCWDSTWKCVSWNLHWDRSSRGSHRPVFADCWLDLMFK